MPPQDNMSTHSLSLAHARLTPKEKERNRLILDVLTKLKHLEIGPKDKVSSFQPLTHFLPLFLNI